MPDCFNNVVAAITKSTENNSSLTMTFFLQIRKGLFLSLLHTFFNEVANKYGYGLSQLTSLSTCRYPPIE